jgi:hypothetical protein
MSNDKKWYCHIVDGRASEAVEHQYPLYMRRGDPAMSGLSRFPRFKSLRACRLSRAFAL